MNETLTIDLTSDGGLVAFHSVENYTGGNAVLEPNVFLAETDGTGILQVTRVPQAFRPQVTGDGSLVVFASDEDLTLINPAGDAQIYRLNSDGSALAQITIGALDPQWIRMAADGSRIAFQSDADPFGANGDNLFEIHVINANGTGHMQLTTSSSHPSLTPEISGNGSLIAIASTADLVAGSNPAFDSQIFVLRADGSGTLQITAGDADSRVPDISADGAFVAFQSLADLTGEKPAAFPGDPTIFRARTDGTELVQVLTDDWLDEPAAFASTRLKIYLIER